MSIIKCKMCGGELNIVQNSTVCECEYCGSKQTVPNTDDEKRLRLYERANKLRFENEFDKAEGVYESIISEFQMEAEAYWGILLCKYGIEYVDDPKTGKKIPTCHRTSFDSIMEDDNFGLVMENADVVARGIYREEAKQIEELRKGIIEVSSKEEAYDIFICYKETADDGQRTIDSVIAQDVYDVLTDKGYRVFFSRITLEDKLGQEYEPYIFAALNSAKVMLVFGTSYDNYNAVWVKNEWSRFLQLMESGQKKTLIPCFKDIDAYDMPKEFAHLQAQDMGKVGAIQDLIRGIDKILGSKNADKESVSILQSSNNKLEYIKRGNIALEDKEWTKADSFFEEVLNTDAECAEAYLGKWLAHYKHENINSVLAYYSNDLINVDRVKIEACPIDENHISFVVDKYVIANYLSEDEIRKVYEYDRTYESEFESRKKIKESVINTVLNNNLFIRAKQYADSRMKIQLEDAEFQIKSLLDDKIFSAKKDDENMALKCSGKYKEHILQADENVEKLYFDADKKRNLEYRVCINEFGTVKTIEDYKRLKNQFIQFGNYKESSEYILKCDGEIKNLIDEKQQREMELIEERKGIEKKNKRKKLIIVSTIIAIIVAVIITISISHKIYLKKQYETALSHYQNKEYTDALDIFKNLGDYNDSISLSEECEKNINYQSGLELFEKGDYEQSYDLLNNAVGENIDIYIEYCEYMIALNDEDTPVNISSLYQNLDLLNTVGSTDVFYSSCEVLRELDELDGTSWKKKLLSSEEEKYHAESIVFDKGIIKHTYKNRFDNYNECTIDDNIYLYRGELYYDTSEDMEAWNTYDSNDFYISRDLEENIENIKFGNDRFYK